MLTAPNTATKGAANMIRHYTEYQGWAQAAKDRGLIVDNGPRHEYPSRADMLATPTAFDVLEEGVGRAGWCEIGLYDYDENEGMLADSTDEWLVYVNTGEGVFDAPPMAIDEVGQCSVCGRYNCPVGSPLAF